MTELCGEPTTGGKPCNMKKGHKAKFHRYRDYKLPMEWIIKSTKSKKVLESGNGRLALGYAMTYWLKKGETLTIEVEP